MINDREIDYHKVISPCNNHYGEKCISITVHKNLTFSSPVIFRPYFGKHWIK